MKEDNMSKLASLIQLFGGMQQLVQPDYRGRQLDLNEQAMQMDQTNAQAQMDLQREQFLQQIAQADRTYGLNERQFEQQGQMGMAEQERLQRAEEAQRQYYQYQMDPNNPQNARALLEMEQARKREPLLMEQEALKNQMDRLGIADTFRAMFGLPQLQMFNPAITPPEEQARRQAQFQDMLFKMGDIPYSFTQQTNNAINNLPR